MPILSSFGAASPRGFGLFGGSSGAGPTPGYGSYIEDIFSTYLYTGNGSTQTISNGMGLAGTAGWSTFSYSASPGDTNAYSVGLDSSGNIYTTISGSNKPTLVKYNSAGTLQWQKNLFETTGGGFFSVSIDSSDNIYACGFTVDGGGVYYILLAKYDTAGNVQWQRSLKQQNSFGYGVKVDSSGNPCVTGRVYDGTNYYAIIAKYNSSGVLQWQRKLQENSTYGNAITTDSSNNVYVCGTGAVDGTNDYILVAKYNSSGVLQWNKSLKQGQSSGNGIAVDGSGNVYISGSPRTGNNYMITAKYNSSGTLQWQRSLTTIAGGGNAVALDSSNNVYVTGFTYIGGLVTFVASYDTSGSLRWQRALTNVASGQGRGITVTSSGNLYLASSGYYNPINPSNATAFVTILKTDGSTTSGSAAYIMSAGTATDAAASATDSTSGATDSAGTATDSAAGATASNASGTASVYGQPAITGGGGLVWAKCRTTTYSHQLYDTSRGATNALFSNLTDAQLNIPTGLTSFAASGFSLGSNVAINAPSETYVSWTFTKTPKFFDIITYTGNGAASQTISHNLQSAPGMIIIKAIDDGTAWPVYHRGLGATAALFLNNTNAPSTASAWFNDTAPTSSNFTVGNAGSINTSGKTYIAYLFAHNAGGFGDDGLQNVISCGSYVAPSQGATLDINLGYEVQYLLIKSTTVANSGWLIIDTMRGLTAQDSDDSWLYANVNSAEASYTNFVAPNATGFTIFGNSATPEIGNPGSTYIYMAIRRGPMRTPTSGTSVFQPVAWTGNSASQYVNTSLSFAPDSIFSAQRNWTAATYQNISGDRLRGSVDLSTQYGYSESTISGNDYVAWPQNGFTISNGNYLNINGRTYVSECIGRAPGFFDVVCYNGSATAKTVAHNLSVAPELMIVKYRNGGASWTVYYGDTSKFVTLDTSDAPIASGLPWNSTAPTSSVFTVGAYSNVNQNGGLYVAYLFATCPNVSKVGSYTGTGSTQTINCGFSGGARFVLIKRTDTTGNWFYWDTARGMVSGTDPYLSMNLQTAEVNADNVLTTTGGFQIVSSLADINASGGSYIFLAIA